MIRRCWLLVLAVLLSCPAFVVAAPIAAGDNGITLSPAGTIRRSVSTSLTLVARTFSAYRGQSVDFRVTTGGGGLDLSLGTATIQSDGTASLSYKRDHAMTDTVAAEITYRGRRRSETVTVVWYGPDPVQVLELFPDGRSTVVGGSFTATAKLTADGKSVNGKRIHFRARGAGPLESGEDTTEGGEATFTYSRAAPGTDTITAIVGNDVVENEPVGFAALPHSGLRPVITHKWLKAPEKLDLTATPDGTSGPVGSTFTVTAKVTSGGVAQKGANVTLTSSMAGSDPVTRTGTTKGSGTVVLEYPRDKPGTDTVSVRAELDGRSATDTLTRRWTPVMATTLDVAATPDGTSGPVGSTFTVTAKVTSGGVAQKGANVTLTSSMSGSDPVTRTGTTKGSGTVVLEYPRDKPGTDTVSVRAELDGRSATDTLTRRWTPVTATTLDVAATPDGTSGPVGSTFTVTAQVTSGGVAQEGAKVTLTSSMAGSDTLIRKGTTNPSGRVFLGYVRDEPGSDTVSVRADLDGRSALVPLTRSWIPVTPTTPVLALLPDGTTGSAGTTFTATATLSRLVGPIVEGVVEFRATMNGQPDRTGKAKTGADGVARFTLTRPVAGTDVIQATALVDGVTAADRIDRRWTSAPTQPLKPDLGTVTPGGEVTVSGGGCRPGAPVVVMLGGKEVATTVARADGAYGVESVLQNLPVGRHSVQISCGGRVSEKTLDVVAVSATTGTAAASVVTSSCVLLFFLLLAITLRPGWMRPSSDRSKPPAAPSNATGPS